MPIIRWRPLEDFFDDISLRTLNDHSCDLATDIYEENSDIIVEIKVAGMDPDKIDISVEDNQLRVAGQRHKETETEDKNYYHREIKRGSFERLIPLPVAVEGERAQAECKDGVIRIMLPKRDRSVSNKIPVNKK